MLPICAVFAETAQLPPAFEVASVKSAPPEVGPSYSGCGRGNPGLVRCTNMPLLALLMEAYGVKRYQIEGPSWMHSELYNVEARVPQGASRDQLPAMWQALLAERFKLTLHKETRVLPVYVLTIGKGGPRLKEIAAAELETPNGLSRRVTVPLPPPPRHEAGDGGGPPMAITGGAAGGPMLGMRTSASGDTAISGRATVSQLIGALSGMVDRPILDGTGLTGTYYIDLTFVASDFSSIQTATVFQAVQRLGLKLEPKKSPVMMMVIDHAGKVPTAN